MAVLIDTLLKENLITREQLGDAKDKQIGAKKPLHELLVEMGFIKEKDMIKASSKVFNMPVVSLEKEKIDPAAAKLLPYEAARKYGALPLRREGETLVLAMSDPQDVVALDEIKMITKTRPKPVLSTKSEIDKFIEKCYQSDDSLYDLLKNIASVANVEVVSEEAAGRPAEDISRIQVESSPVVRLVSLILTDALKERASDIHIEPREDVTEIRYRIDGDLKSIMTVPAKLHPPLVARIKILSNLNIAEKRKPQDGRTRVRVAGQETDIRVSTVPTFHDEKVVLRLLSDRESVTDLEKIGFRAEELEAFMGEITRPQGMILITGPTGSGKTSTLYAALKHIKSETKNIITIEDPIEYLIPGINQIQVNLPKDVTFANGLRSILRQDPNVILVGEIRDRDTADIAFRASLTGHLVFSTVHTNDAVSSITRLLDIGLEAFIIASSLILVVSQRLVRLACPSCKEEYKPDEKVLDRFRPFIEKYRIKRFYRGAGCDKCGYAGFRGRTAIFEIMKFNENIRAFITKRAPEDEIRKAAGEAGMKPLAESGVEKVAEGLTTLEEVARIADVVEKKPAAAAAPAAAIRERQTILVVDDEADIRKVLEKRLAIAGYDVMTARNGREGVEAAVKEKPDLVIMDIMMPEMDGFEATKTLRSRLETAVIPIIMLTAKQDKESELKGLDAGADDYITKPFDKDKLLARVNMLLKRKRG